MLYEVITILLAKYVADSSPEDAIKLMQEVLVLDPLNAGTHLEAGHRITSYNVCYTKLLRAERLRRDDRHPAAGVQRHDTVAGCERAAHRAGHGSCRRLDRDAGLRR